MRYILSVVLLTLAACDPAYAGYSIFTRPQVTPQYVTVHGVGKLESRLNLGAAVEHPPTYGRLVCKTSPFNQYSTAENRRQEVWEDSVGTATDSQVLAVCTGLKPDIAKQIKEIRQQAFDAVTRVLVVYEENYAAAKAYKDGFGASTIMKGGQTAAVYLSGFGAQLGMSAGQFADYVITENHRVGPTVYDIEQQYLWFAYTEIPAETLIDNLLDLPNQYRRYCGL